MWKDPHSGSALWEGDGEEDAEMEVDESQGSPKVAKARRKRELDEVEDDAMVSFSIAVLEGQS